MQWIHFIGGKAKSGKLVAVAIGTSDNPEAEVAALRRTQPFDDIELLGLEPGSQSRLEALRERFKRWHLNGPWYKAEAVLQTYVGELEPVDRDMGKGRRVSLDLGPEEILELECMVTETNKGTKSRFLRSAYKTYGKLRRYAAQGYTLQALRDGNLVQIPDLDEVPDP